MSDELLTIDGIPEAELPAFARDGRTGDRVSFLEAGLLHVIEGRATLVRWADVLGVLEHEGEAFVLGPRRPPREPCLAVSRELLGDEPDAVGAFVRRVRERGAGSGYRDAVRQHRQGLAPDELVERVRARAAVPGALEVPSSIYIGKLGHPLEGLVLFGIVLAGWLSGVVGIIAVAAIAGASGYRGAEAIIQLSGLVPYVGVVLAAFVAVRLRRAWRAARKAELPRQRVLVLAPDGCVIGFRTGVRTLAWSDVGSFAIGPTEPSYDEGLVVHDANGKKLGDLDAGWLEQPLGLVVAVAETYRRAAR
ncbi:MAG: hypothetical protein KC619_04695 [Myxococcales bacterium]|nr:hypothetical protein [Myxococcales bacterium]